MKASDIRARAFGLADLVNSPFPSYNDVAQGLFEAYRDIYDRYVFADSDFFLEEAILPVLSSELDPNASSGLLEYLLPLPSDFLRLRYVEWMGNIAWQAMEKFSVRNKNTWGSYPRYRLQNGNLWVIGSTVMGLSQVRIGYYPMQPVATIPDVDYAYGSSIALSNRPLVTFPCYCDQEESLLYVYNGENIQIDSLLLGTSSVVLYTGGSTITDLVYYAGNVYFLMGGEIYAAPFVQGGPIVPASIMSSVTVTSFSISRYDNLIYFTAGTNIYTCSLSGSNKTTYLSGKNGSCVYNFNGEFGIYVSGGALLTTTGVTLIASGVVSASSDGSTYVFWLDTSGNLWSATITTETVLGVAQTPALANVSLLRAKVSLAGPYFASGFVIPGSTPAVLTGRIGLLDWAMDLLAISSVADYDFDFPNNEANELMAFRLALDFKRKQSGAAEVVALLQERMEEIGTRFEDVIRRDDFEPERIGNVYSRGWW